MGVPRPFYVDSPSTLEDNEAGLDISTDPDLRHDKLPQPFRLVNKIVEGLFEGSWESITARMAEKEKGADCKKLPDVSYPNVIYAMSDVLSKYQPPSIHSF